jgi:hypothetical protein
MDPSSVQSLQLEVEHELLNELKCVTLGSMASRGPVTLQTALEVLQKIVNESEKELTASFACVKETRLDGGMEGMKENIPCTGECGCECVSE